jgi:Cu(I)/Ag(I) efflux system membrane protein CusA/SilA
VIARLVTLCARHHRMVIAGALLAAAAGALGWRGLPRDVIPDLGSPQVVLLADWMGHPATEVAEAITGVLTGALEGVPGATAVRGLSMADMATIAVVFDSAGALAAGRQAVNARVAAARARLPAAARVQVGPEASGTGWVFQYVLVDPSHGQPLPALRRLQDQVLRPALQAIPGVAEVASVGGDVQQVLVDVSAEELRAHAAAFGDVADAVAGWLPAHPQASLRDLEAVLLPAPPGRAPLRVGDVARARLARDMPGGFADLAGVFPSVAGVVVARAGADAGAVVTAVRGALAAMRPRLPPGVQVVPVYDRLALATRVERSLTRALAEEIAVVVLVILLFLLHGPSALVPLATLPLVVLLTLAAMRLCGVPATIMSLGGIGIALGMAVDADLVALEACHRHLEAAGADAHSGDRRARLIEAAGAFAPAVLTSLLIAASSFLPVLAFTGESGRLLRPLAVTKTLVIAAAALVAVTVAPALRDRLLRGRIPPELANPLTRALVRAYRPFVDFALRRPALTLLTAGLALASCLPLLPRLRGEFLPRVDEGDLLFMPTTLPGATADEVAGQLREQDRTLAGFPEVATVFGKAGRADTATDPAPLSMIETTIHLRPREDWPRVARARWYSSWAPPGLRRVLGLLWPEQSVPTTAELTAALDRATRLPGWTSAWTAPARARIDMTSTGLRTPVGIRIVAPDPARLDALGAALEALAARVPGVRSAAYESLGGEPRLDFSPDAAALARHRVDPARARATAAVVTSGGVVGDLERDGRRLRVRVALDSTLRGPADQLRAATVRASPDGVVPAAPVPLALVGRPVVAAAPSVLRSERGALCAYVHVDLVDGSDIEGWVARARADADRAVAAGTLVLRAGERIEWTGQHDLFASGRRRLRWIVPSVVLSMLLLLYLQFRSLTAAVIVLASVPFALVGSVWTLALAGYALSPPVWVGLLSVIGLAMQTGVVMVVYIDDAFHRRVRAGQLRTRDDIVAAHAEGTVQRLRPKVMTIATMAAGLLPLLWADGAGSEIMRRVAAPMVGGLLTSAFLTLEVLPVLYTIWRHGQLRRAQRAGVSIEAVVGAVPGWVRARR